MKIIIYQILTRLWGNDNPHPVSYGDKDLNGCGTMADVSNLALKKIKDFGITHVWYTGLIAHATATDYTAYGIPKDHSAMVKGKAGSPYAIKDYYDIDPDLARPQRRWADFKSLVERTHRAGLGFIMDFVPNHVARQYHSIRLPEGKKGLGDDDNPTQAFSPRNNFYYIPGTPLQCRFDMKGEEDVPYTECPARATGNDCFTANPGRNDWYETIKLNYGVDYLGGGRKRFIPIPDTWQKMLDILLFWSGQGVDGFRCDMAEMVPVEFWNWAVRRVKEKFPNILFIGEVYNPTLYRDYLYRGGFDYLYDKVGLYDTLRAVTCGMRPASDITFCWQKVGDIQSHMLNFLENHDEQRLASDFFAGGDGSKGRPALVVATCMNTNPMMIYFGQELGERGMDSEGFSGRDGRTTIFDYWSVDTIRRRRNGGRYTLSRLTESEKRLHLYYHRVLMLSNREAAIREGLFFDLMYVNYENPAFRSDRLFAFVRKSKGQAIFVIANFSDEVQPVKTLVPSHAFDYLNLQEGDFEAEELLSGKKRPLSLRRDKAFDADVQPWDAVMLKICFDEKG